MDKPKIKFDDQLREVAENETELRNYVLHLQEQLALVTDAKTQVSALGELGLLLDSNMRVKISSISTGGMKL